MLGRVLTRTEQLLLLTLAVSLVVGIVSYYYYRNLSRPVAPTVLPVAVEPAVPRAPLEAAPPPATAPLTAVPPTEPDPPAVPIAISVMGAVNRPGVVRVPCDARVQDAIAQAGGASEEADMSDLNLAALLVDGSTLTVPARALSRREAGRLTARGGATAAELNPPQYTISGWNGTTPGGAPVPVETAPRTAAREADAEPSARPSPKTALLDINFATVEELDTLPGIGPKLAAEIVAYREHTPFTSVEDITNVPGIGDRKLEAIRKLIIVQRSSAGSVAANPDEPAKPKHRAPSKTASP